MTGKAIAQTMQNIADDGSGWRGHHANHLWQVRQRLLAAGIKQAFGSQLAFALFQQGHERAHAGRFYIFNDDLVVRFAGVRGDLAGGYDFQPLLHFCAQFREIAAPDHGVKFCALRP